MSDGRIDARTADPPTTGDLEVMAAARDWLAAKQRVALVTVLRTWGSSPRPPGALLAIAADSGLAGSVSGGCVEQALAERWRRGDWSGRLPLRIDLGVSSDEALRVGLPCGGRLELLIEEPASHAALGAVIEQAGGGRLVARRVCLATGEVSLHDGAGRPELSVDDLAVTKVFGPAWHLLLVGDGQLARALARMARMLDYRVTICDPRETFADPDPLPDVHYTRQMPDDAVRTLADDPRSGVVTLAHDPRQDDLALIEALPSRAFYVGALGSRRSAASRAERLAAMDLSAEQIARLDAPAGIAIGSKRPAEIALSILAGITAVRNGVSAPVDKA
jgi:xanthine dehydrogenase accessory factor